MKLVPSTRPQVAIPLFLFSLCLCFALCSIGCGRATYERRLQKTVELAKYREKLDNNLALNYWQQNGVQIRAPRQFTRLDGPVEPELEEGEEPSEEVIPDPRQPNFMSVPLPGLLGAWRADVALSDSDGTAPAYMYVLSNYEMWTMEGQGEKALEFNQGIAPVAIVDGLSAKMPEQAEWVSESHPRRGGFVPTNVLTAAMVKSNVELPVAAGGEDGGSASQVAEIPVNCKMYLAENKDIHVLVLFIVPEQVDAREQLSLDTEKGSDSRVAMCLETLKVPGKKPKVGSGKDGKGGGGRGGF